MTPPTKRWQEIGALGLLLAVVLISPWPLGGRAAWFDAGSAAIIIAAGAGWIAVRIASASASVFYRNWLYLPIIGFLSVGGLLWGLNRSASAHASAIAWLSTLAAATLFLLAHQVSSRSRRAGGLLFAALGLSGVTVALAAALQGALDLGPGFGLLADPLGGAAVGPFNNRNYFAGFMLVSLAPCLALALERTGAARFAGWSGTALGVVAIVGSGSRAGVAALLLVALAALGTVDAPRRRRLVTASVVVVLLASWLWLAPIDRVAARIEVLGSPTAEISAAKRLWIWQDAVGLVPAHPMLGSGLGTFGVVFASQRTQPDAHVTLHAHNEPLELLIESGIVGFALAVWFVATLLWQLIGAVGRDTGADRVRAMGALFAWLGLLAFALVDLPTVSPAINYALAILAGVGVAAARAQRPALVAPAEVEKV